MADSQRLELFVLRDAQGPILYAPLGRRMARLNEPAARLALAYAQDPSVAEDLDADGRVVPTAKVPALR